MMNVLVTGGAGYIGSHVVEELQKNALAKLPALPDSAVINAYKNRLLLLQQTKKAYYTQMKYLYISLLLIFDISKVRTRY